MATNKKKSKDAIDDSDRARALELAPKILTLVQFAALLIPDIDILEQLAARSSERVLLTMSAAPVIMAMGENYDQKEFQHQLESKRAYALLNLVQVLKETEDERIAFENQEVEKKKGRNFLKEMGI